METPKTLPVLSIEYGWPIDLARKVLRETPELKGLGTWIGSARVFTSVEAAKIGEVVARRLAKRAAVVT